MRKTLFVLCLLFLIPLSGFAETSCGKIERLRQEWIALEEKTSGGMFFSSTTEVRRLHTLREIMRQPASVQAGCNNKKVKRR
jgi:hypothetical protein